MAKDKKIKGFSCVNESFFVFFLGGVFFLNFVMHNGEYPRTNFTLIGNMFVEDH